MAAFSLIRNKSYLGAYIRRQRSRLGAHKLARILYTVMRYGVAYQKQSEEAFAMEHQQRQEKSLRRRVKELGYELEKIEPAPIEAEAQATCD